MTSKRVRRYLSALALLGLAGLTLAAAWKVRHKIPRRDSLVRVGQPLPSLVVFDRAGKACDLSKMDPGTRRVIIFYSPTCEVCQKELPELAPFPGELKAIYVKEGDAPSGDRLTDRDGVLKRAFMIPSLPTLLFVDEQGIVRDGLIGAHAAGSAHQKLLQFAHSGA